MSFNNIATCWLNIIIAGIAITVVFFIIGFRNFWLVVIRILIIIQYPLCVLFYKASIIFCLFVHYNWILIPSCIFAKLFRIKNNLTIIVGDIRLYAFENIIILEMVWSSFTRHLYLIFLQVNIWKNNLNNKHVNFFILLKIYSKMFWTIPHKYLWPDFMDFGLKVWLCFSYVVQ